MPDSGQPSTGTGETLPEWRRNLQQAIGEDPARYLDNDLVDGECRELALARISGIARIEVIRAWRAAERRLASRDDREPRRKILELLEDREADLQENGERPRDIRAALEDDPESVPDRYWPARGSLEDRPDPLHDRDDLYDHPSPRERLEELVARKGLTSGATGSTVLEDARTTQTTKQSGLAGYATDGGQPDPDDDGDQEEES